MWKYNYSARNSSRLQLQRGFAYSWLPLVASAPTMKAKYHSWVLGRDGAAPRKQVGVWAVVAFGLGRVTAVLRAGRARCWDRAREEAKAWLKEDLGCQRAWAQPGWERPRWSKSRATHPKVLRSRPKYHSGGPAFCLTPQALCGVALAQIRLGLYMCLVALWCISQKHNSIPSRRNSIDLSTTFTRQSNDGM